MKPASSGSSEQPDVVQRLGPAWHKRVAGLHVAKLSGTPYEMGRQHGALLGDALAEGPLTYYGAYIQRILGHGAAGALAPALCKLLRATVGRRVARALPPEGLEVIRGLADGGDLSYETIMDGAVMPDSMLWIVARLMRLKRVGRAIDHRLALGLGCTSAIAWGDATTDGRLLHARNFDYHGVACWPATAAVIFYEPSHGQRYVSVAAAGVPMGGVTAMNEAGLTLTVHQHMFTDRTRLGGTPVGYVGDQVMSQARDLEEAKRLLDAVKPIGCWTYLVTDGNRREVLCYEENPDRKVALTIPDHQHHFGYANIYLDKELGATERDLYGSYWRANKARHRRANELLNEGHGGLDPAAMAAILADRGRQDCRLSESIAMLMTVGSVVFRPDDGALWVANGQAPVSRNAFIPFSLRLEDHAPELGVLRDHVRAECPSERAFEAYRDAYIAWFDQDDCPTARAKMREASLLQPKQPLYHALEGLLAVEAGDGDAARVSLDAALQLGHPHPPRTASFYLWRGRALDLCSQRSNARKDYREVLRHSPDAAVRRAARRGLRRPYRSGHTQRLAIDFAFADVMAP